MNQQQNENTKNHLSLSHLRYHFGTTSFSRILVKKSPSESMMKPMQKKSPKQIMPKYILHGNCQIQKQKLLHQIEQQNRKLRKQFTIKQSLQKKLQQKNNQFQEPQIQFRNKKQTHLRKKIITLTKNPKSSNKTMTIMQKSFQNELKSINNQIQVVTKQKQNNEKKIQVMKQSQKYTRFMENQQEKMACLNGLKQMRQKLKALKSEIRRLKRIHLQEKNIKIRQLLMQGQIKDSIQYQNILVYNLIQEITNQIKNVSLKKANLYNKKQTLLKQIENIKLQNRIPPQVLQSFQKTIQASKKWSYYRFQQGSNKSTRIKTQNVNQKSLSALKEQQSQEQDSMMEYAAQNDFEVAEIKSQEPQSGQNETIQGKKNRIKQEQLRKTMEQLQKKYFYDDVQFQKEDSSDGDEDDLMEQVDNDTFQTGKVLSNIGKRSNQTENIRIRGVSC